MSAPEGSTVAVRGSDVRAPSAAPMLTLVEMLSVSIDHAATSRPLSLIDTSSRSKPGAPEFTPTAVPCVASCLIARSCAVRVGAPPVPKSWTPWPFAPAA